MGVIHTSRTRADDTAPDGRTAAATSMVAMTQRGYGSPDVLELSTVDVPAISADQVLVRVHAASIGAWVDHLVAGDPLLTRLQLGLPRPRRATRASDIAGEVVAVGSEVGRFRPGDRVYGEASAAFAEYAAVDATALAAAPRNLTAAQAASLPIAGQTALLGLRDHGQLRAGQHVLVIGAAGGVGSLAVQMATARGAEVTAVCSTSGVELVRSLGARHVVDYTRGSATDTGRRYDLVLQFGGAQSISELRKLATPHGTVVLSSAEGGRWFGSLGRLAVAFVLTPFVGQRLRSFVASTNVANLMQITTMVERGDVVPVVDRTYPLHAMADALRRFRQPHGRGKVVVTIADPARTGGSTHTDDGDVPTARRPASYDPEPPA